MNLPLFPSSRHWRMLILAAVSLLAMTAPRHPVATAADLVWVGNDAFNNSNFSDSGNWQGNTLPSWGYTNSLKFNQNQNSNVTGLNYNWGDWRLANDISWDSSFPVARTLSASNGGGINFRTRIENNSSFTQTVTMNLSGGSDGASDIQLNPVKGSLTLSGIIFNDNSVDYTVYGSDTGTTTNLTLNTALGPITPTQANVDFTVAGGRNTAVQVNASQLWAGTTTVNSGDFTTGNGVTLASTAIIVGGGTVATTSANTFADTASLTVNTGRLVIGGNDTVASLSGTSGTVELASGATLTFGGSGSAAYGGTITGAGGITKQGSGVVTISGSNSFSGVTRVVAGTLNVGWIPAQGRQSYALSRSTLDMNAADSGTVTFAGLGFTGDAVWIGGLIGSRNLNVGSLTVVVGGNDEDNTYGGDIALSFGGYFIKRGSGTFSYTGSTSGTQGAFLVDEGTFANVGGFVGGAVQLSSGACLAGTGTFGQNLNVGDNAIHSPGNSPGVPGVQTINRGVSYGIGSTIFWDLIANTTGSAGVDYDQIKIPAGQLNFNPNGTSPTLSLSFNAPGSSVDWSSPFWDVNRAWRVWDLDTLESYNVDRLSVGGSLLDSLGNTLSPTTRGSFSISKDGQDVMLNFVAVPEPSTVCMTVGGLGLATALRYQRRRARDS